MSYGSQTLMAYLLAYSKFQKKKKRLLLSNKRSEYGGEGGIRTPDTLPYTHFPGVLLQPLGHLTILYCCLTAWGQRGATIGSCAKTVKQNLRFNYRLVMQ